MDSRLTPQWQPAFDQRVAADREFMNFAEIATFLRQYFRTIAACSAVAMLCAWFYVATTDRVFTAETQILIEPKIPQLFQQQSAEVNLTLDTAQVESQMAVMQSEKIAAMVIEGLRLSEDPVFNRSDDSISTNRLSTLLTVLGWRLDIADSRWFQSLEAFFDGVAGGGNKGGERRSLSEFERGRHTMSVFRKGLDVRRVGVSYVIDISFQSVDPGTAAKVANATAEAFVQEQLETKATAAREGGAWLELRLNELRTQMNEATKVAQEFRAKHDYGVGRRQTDGSAVGRDRDGVTAAPAPTLEELEVAADTYRKMYESFLQAYTNSVSQQSYPVADARVITAATRPLVPSAPRSKLIFAFGALAGLMAGVGVAFLRHTLDRTLRSSSQLQKEFGLECIGELPPASWRDAFGTLDEVAVSPSSKYSNSVRRVKTAISLADSARSPRRIGIVSALPSDGKSSFASNLAAFYSMCDTRTLVIDADVFHSVLSKSLLPKPKDASGAQALSAEPVVRRIVLSANATFDMLPSSLVDARHLLVPKNMRILLPELQSYEMVIVDLPPFTCGSEELAVTPLLDGVILVAEFGRTPVDLFGELVRSMHASKTSIIGVLMTNTRIRSTKDYGGGRRRAR